MSGSPDALTQALAAVRTAATALHKVADSLSELRSDADTTTVQTPAARGVVPLWPDAAERLGIGRTTAYALAANGTIPVVRLGRRVLVSEAVPDRLLAGELARPTATHSPLPTPLPPARRGRRVS